MGNFNFEKSHGEILSMSGEKSIGFFLIFFWDLFEEAPNFSPLRMFGSELFLSENFVAAVLNKGVKDDQPWFWDNPYKIGKNRMEFWRVFPKRFLVPKLVNTWRKKGVFVVMNLLPQLMGGLKCWIVLVDAEVGEQRIFAPKRALLKDSLLLSLRWSHVGLVKTEGNQWKQAIFAEKT